MNTQHAPGVWEAVGHLCRRSLAKHWTVQRKLSSTEIEWMTNAAGRRKRFKSEAAALAAIAKAAKTP